MDRVLSLLLLQPLPTAAPAPQRPFSFPSARLLLSSHTHALPLIRAPIPTYPIRSPSGSTAAAATWTGRCSRTGRWRTCGHEARADTCGGYRYPSHRLADATRCPLGTGSARSMSGMWNSHSGAEAVVGVCVAFLPAQFCLLFARRKRRRSWYRNACVFGSDGLCCAPRRPRDDGAVPSHRPQQGPCGGGEEVRRRNAAPTRELSSPVCAYIYHFLCHIRNLGIRYHKRGGRRLEAGNPRHACHDCLRRVRMFRVRPVSACVRRRRSQTDFVELRTYEGLQKMARDDGVVAPPRLFALCLREVLLRSAAPSCACCGSGGGGGGGGGGGICSGDFSRQCVRSLRTRAVHGWCAAFIRPNGNT